MTTDILPDRLASPRYIALTFDDGPNPVTTPAILDVLAEYDIEAAFFVVGMNLETEENRRAMRRAYAEGHLIGNHTYSHPALTKLSPGEIREELRRTQDLIGDCAGGPRLFRPPFAILDARVSRIIREEGFDLAMWNVDSLDWKFRSSRWVDVTMKHVLATEVSLILMHDTHPTAEHLSALIDRIRALPGHRFLTYRLPAQAGPRDRGSDASRESRDVR